MRYVRRALRQEQLTLNRLKQIGLVLAPDTVDQSPGSEYGDLGTYQVVRKHVPTSCCPVSACVKEVHQCITGATAENTEQYVQTEALAVALQ